MNTNQMDTLETINQIFEDMITVSDQMNDDLCLIIDSLTDSTVQGNPLDGVNPEIVKMLRTLNDKISKHTDTLKDNKNDINIFYKMDT
jgi:uncharacterized coiled-coil protein SlyX